MYTLVPFQILCTGARILLEAWKLRKLQSLLRSIDSGACRLSWGRSIKILQHSLAIESLGFAAGRLFDGFVDA